MKAVIDETLATLQTVARKEATYAMEDVQAVVAAMSPELRAAFVLSDGHGMSPAEVAAALEIAPATARTRIHRARARIRSALERGDDA